MILPVHVEDQHDVVLLGPVSQQPHHGHAGVTRPVLSEGCWFMNRMYADGFDILILPVKYIVEEYVETL